MPRHKTTGPTARELAIFRILWDRGPSTVGDVHKALHEEGPTGYTTALKLMQIMTDKGLLIRDEGVRPHVYRPAFSEERTQKQVVGDLLDRVFAGSAETLVMRALSARKVSTDELKRIRQMLDDIEGE
jgi:BlaI family penicillinase repressor